MIGQAYEKAFITILSYSYWHFSYSVNFSFFACSEK